jgi:hypothetical protein
MQLTVTASQAHKSSRALTLERKLLALARHRARAGSACLVAHIPNNAVLRALVYIVQRQGELDHAKAGAKMAAGLQAESAVSPPQEMGALAQPYGQTRTPCPKLLTALGRARLSDRQRTEHRAIALRSGQGREGANHDWSHTHLASSTQPSRTGENIWDPRIKSCPSVCDADGAERSCSRARDSWPQLRPYTNCSRRA